MPRPTRGLNITNKPAMSEDKIKEIFSKFTSSWSFEDPEINNKNSSASSSPKK
jgi:hypothetical protein